MPGRFARNAVRSLAVTALLAALSASSLVPIPKDLPTIALAQPGLYRLEIGLLVFYSCLLFITPSFSALAWGQLPIEISTRGARFAEESGRTAEQDEATIKELEQTAGSLKEGLAKATSKINRLEKQIQVTKHDRD